MRPDGVILRIVFGCLNCDKPIPMREANKGKQLCSMKCLREINKSGGNFDKTEVWKK